MSKLNDVISEDIFLNAFHILQEYMSNQGSSLIDTNLRLIRPYFDRLNDRTVKKFYKMYIQDEKVYAIPELCMSEIVTIPKSMTGVREYRYMSSFAHILYTAFGLVFVECTSPLIDTLNFKERSIFPYFPTRFIKRGSGKKEWIVKNKYREEYSNFIKKLELIIEPGDVIIKTDISAYFERINHRKLLTLLDEFSFMSSLRLHNIREDTYDSLEFYIDNLMQGKIGIPQGRKNFASDFFGYFYLIPFDNQISELCVSQHLAFKASIRYVDDTYVVLKKTDETIGNKEVNRELLSIEQRVSSWLFDELGLTLNPAKTRRIIITTEAEKTEFIRDTSKSVSQSDNKAVVLRDGKEAGFNDLKEALSKLCFTDDNRFETNILSRDQKESLKFVFSPRFKKLMTKKSKRDEIYEALKSIDIEVAVDDINIISQLFVQDGDARFKKLVIDDIFRKNNYIDLRDRRAVHIILTMLAYFSAPRSLAKNIDKNDTVKSDSYGQYLAIAVECDRSKLENSSISRRIEHEFRGHKFKRYINTTAEYNRVIDKIMHSNMCSGPLIQAIKLYNYEMCQGRWDVAFNQLQSIFHEIMKLKYGLGDGATISDIANKLTFLSPRQELLLRKFYDRRNFNPISHPSKKGLPAEKVGLTELESYRHDILNILDTCFDKWCLED